MSRRLDRLPVTVIAGLCGGEPATYPGLVAELLPGVRRIPLSGLDAGSVARMITAHLDVPPAGARPSVSTLLPRTSGG